MVKLASRQFRALSGKGSISLSPAEVVAEEARDGTRVGLGDEAVRGHEVGHHAFLPALDLQTGVLIAIVSSASPIVERKRFEYVQAGGEIGDD